jgi:hypothetical protein
MAQALRSHGGQRAASREPPEPRPAALTLIVAFCSRLRPRCSSSRICFAMLGKQISQAEAMLDQLRSGSTTEPTWGGDEPLVKKGWFTAQQEGDIDVKNLTAQEAAGALGEGLYDGGIAPAELLGTRVLTSRWVVVGTASMVRSKRPGDPMPRALLVSVIEDDRFFRDSMRRLMRSLGYAVGLLFCSRFPGITSPRRNELPDL